MQDLPDQIIQELAEADPEKPGLAEFRKKMQEYLRTTSGLAVKLVFISNEIFLPWLASKGASITGRYTFPYVYLY